MASPRWRAALEVAAAVVAAAGLIIALVANNTASEAMHSANERADAANAVASAANGLASAANAIASAALVLEQAQSNAETAADANQVLLSLRAIPRVIDDDSDDGPDASWRQFNQTSRTLTVEVHNGSRRALRSTEIVFLASRNRDCTDEQYGKRCYVDPVDSAWAIVGDIAPCTTQDFSLIRFMPITGIDSASASVSWQDAQDLSWTAQTYVDASPDQTGTTRTSTTANLPRGTEPDKPSSAPLATFEGAVSSEGGPGVAIGTVSPWDGGQCGQ